jgi:hypothetical protein
MISEVSHEQRSSASHYRAVAPASLKHAGLHAAASVVAELFTGILLGVFGRGFASPARKGIPY